MPLRWEELPDAEPDDFDVRTVPGCTRSAGTRTRGMDDDAGRAGDGAGVGRADERDHGLGDMPYPPEYPKMPGEPKRVQPSKARADTLGKQA